MSRSLKLPSSCNHCRRLRRKCDRSRPACSRCASQGKTCEYLDSDNPYPQPASPDIGPVDTTTVPGIFRGASSSNGQSPVLSSKWSTSTDRRIASSSTSGINSKPAFLSFPHSFFLDPDYFTPISEDVLCTMSSAVRPLVSQVLSFLPSDLSAVGHAYSLAVNRWFSILSPLRLSEEISYTMASLSPQHVNSVEPTLIILLASLRITYDPAFIGPCPEYVIAKTLSSALENEGLVSMRLLQSLIFLTAYELGHSIYPNAYLTLGRAARLAMLMGLPNRGATQHLFKPADTLTGQEEGRRAWWAIFIMDRFCQLTNPNIALALPEPPQAVPLPISDMGWQSNQISGVEASKSPEISDSSLTSSSPSVGHFSTMCQASHLMGLVLKHLTCSKPPAGDDGHNSTEHFDEALQLHNTLVALDSCISLGDWQSEINHNNLEVLSMVCSSRFILYNKHGCNEPDVRSGADRLRVETEIKRESVAGIIKLATVRVPELARIVVTGAENGQNAQNGRNIGFMLAQCFYHAATECAWFIREGFGSVMASSLDVIISALKIIAKSWDLAERYLALLDNDKTAARFILENHGPDAHITAQSTTGSPVTEVVN